MHLVAVPFEAVAVAWPRVDGWLAAACARPGCDLDAAELKHLCLARQAQLVTIHDDEGRPRAAGVTQVRDYEDGRRSCWILRLGGTAAGVWPAVIAQVEAGARRLGCGSVEFVGRRGWRRIFPDYDATPEPGVGYHFTKDVRRGR